MALATFLLQDLTITLLFLLLHIRHIVTVVVELVFEIKLTEPLYVKIKIANYLHEEASEVLNININIVF